MKRLFLAIAIGLSLTACSTPTTEKPAEAVTVKKYIRYYFEFNKLTQSDYSQFEASIPDRYLTFDEIKQYRDIARSKALGRASNYDAQRADFYDYFVPMGMTTKEVDVWMDKIDARGNGLLSSSFEGYMLVLYVEVQ
jgi:hypothetical protein